MTAQDPAERWAEQRPEGCTVVLCTAPSCCTPLSLPLLTALRTTVRATRHAVLVTTGCLLGPLACHPRRPGPLVLIQPCDVQRQPLGCAILVGPLRDDADVAAVAEWVADGGLEPTLLPQRLQPVHAAARPATGSPLDDLR